MCVCWLFPEGCASCREGRSSLCNLCYKKILPLTCQYCPYCRRRNALGRVCGVCAKRKSPLAGLFVVTLYSEMSPIQRVIHAAKYRGRQDLLQHCGELLGAAGEVVEVRSMLHRKEATLVPVPLSHQRLRERGFNQSTILARAFQKHLKLPLCASLARNRDTVPQATLNRAERLTNLQGAFTCREKPPEVCVLVDDVATTISTLEACAQTLLASGCREVWGLVLARPSSHR